MAEAAATPDLPRGPDILVAVGGGVLGRSLLETAAAAGAASERPWHLLVGGPDGAEIAATLSARHGRPGLTIEAARRDYRTLLAAAACSISLAGYNTALDLAGCQTPALLAPWTSGGEQEQAIRAAALAAFPGFAILPEDMGPEDLRRRAEAAALGPRRDRLTIGRDGAPRTAAILSTLLRNQEVELSESLDASNPSDDGSNS